MSILCLTSCGGSPGATTLAVGLALTWPRPVLLVDADPGAHQAVLAGYLAGHSANGKGLLRVAEAQRDRRPLREVLIDQTLELGSEQSVRRLLLPGFTRASAARNFQPVWPDLTDAFLDLDALGFDVVVDCGRLGPEGIPPALADHAALTGLVMRSSLRSVISATVHLPALVDGDVPGGRVGIIVVGDGAPYGQREIARALNTPVLGSIAHDPGAAEHWSDGAQRRKRFESSALVRTVADLGSRLAQRLDSGDRAAVAAAREDV